MPSRPEPPEAFYTVHRPRQHEARMTGTDEQLVEPKETEIDLVQELGNLGINLKHYRYFNSRGDEKFLTVNWEKQKPSPTSKP